MEDMQLNSFVQEIETIVSNPFKGAKSYEEKDSLGFYGRNEEMSKLFQLIRLNVLSIFYSQSGIGKSSLLKAGLMPTLRHNDYLPIYIRPNYGDYDLDLKSFIINQISVSIDRMTATSEHTEHGYSFSRPLEDESLYEYFHKNPFFKYIPIEGEPGRAEVSTLTPVLIFDQFEEIFTIGSTNQRLFSFFERELSYLIENNIPPELVDKINQNDDASENEIRLIEYSTKIQNYRVIFSLREEFLSNLESLRHYMPSVFFTTSRFRLLPFTQSTAQDVILKISDFVFDTETSLNVIDLISKNHNTGNADRRQKNEVEPFLLSLICFHLYPKMIIKDRDTINCIETKDYKLVDKILTSYYKESLENMPDEVRVFIEEELLTDKGNRTLHNNEDAEKKLGKQYIDRLVDEFRLLRKEEFLDSQHLEIIHDRITPIIIESRTERRIEEKKKALELEKIKQAEETQRLNEKRLLEFEKSRAVEFEIRVKELEESLKKASDQKLLEEKEKTFVLLEEKYQIEKDTLIAKFNTELEEIKTDNELQNKKREHENERLNEKTKKLQDDIKLKNLYFSSAFFLLLIILGFISYKYFYDNKKLASLTVYSQDLINSNQTLTRIEDSLNTIVSRRPATQIYSDSLFAELMRSKKLLTNLRDSNNVLKSNYLSKSNSNDSLELYKRMYSSANTQLNSLQKNTPSNSAVIDTINAMLSYINDQNASKPYSAKSLMVSFTSDSARLHKLIFDLRSSVVNISQYNKPTDEQATNLKSSFQNLYNYLSNRDYIRSIVDNTTEDATTFSLLKMRLNNLKNTLR
jgi:hypothetical protein